MQDELPKLIKLQEMDSAIDDLLSQAKRVEPQVAKKNREIDDLKSSLKAFKEKGAALQHKKKDLEAQADAKEALVKKHQGELNSLKSNDAYKAMLGEIETAKSALTKIEDEILSLMEQSDAADRDYKDADQKLKTQEGMIRSQIQELEKKMADLSAAAQVKQAERTQFTSEISKPNLSQYESLRNNKGGLAIVPLLNNGCGGCRLSLTPNKLNEIKRGKIVVTCDACSRIIHQGLTASAENPQPTEAVSPTVPFSQP